MEKSSVILTDTQNSIWVEQLDQQFGSFQVVKRTLRGGRQDGVDVIDVVRDHFVTRIIPTRGMGLAEVTLGSDSESCRFGWNSPVCGPVHPNWVPVAEPSGLGWLDGFNELFVRCGLKSNGAPEFDEAGQLQFPLHGRIANLPANQVQINYDPSSETLEIIGTVIESRFHFDKFQLVTCYRFDSSSTSIKVSDEVTNFGGSRNDFQMLYHYNLGPGLLEPGGQIMIPAEEVVPRDLPSAEHIADWQQVQPPKAGSTETAYFFKPKANSDGNSLALLTNSDKSLAAGIRYSPAILPCFTLWKNSVSEHDGYVIGLEPGTNFPNTHSFEAQHDRVVSLEPAETKSIEFELVFANSSEVVATLVDESKAVQADSAPEISDMPRPSWCE